MNYRVEAITRPPKHHFFGYYDMKPWDPTGRYHLVLEVDFVDRPPGPDDEAVVGVVDLQDGNKFIPLARTRAWNFQQGAMLHWYPLEERTVLFNDRREGRFVCVAHEMDSGSERVIGPAISALSDDGRWAATLNFARIAVTRPGYGYEGLPDPFHDQPAPAEDGLGIIDTAAGEHRVIVSVADLAEMQREQYGLGKMWFNHVLFNPSGTRVAFLFRGPKPPGPFTTEQLLAQWYNLTQMQMWTVGIDGQNPVKVLDGPMVSHFDWKDDETLIAYASVNNVDAVWEFDALGRGEPKTLFADVIQEDGHICFSHDRRWVATDTYPDPDGMRRLSIVEYATGREVSLGAYYSPTPEKAEVRCDFHPSWSGDDMQIAFDGIHEGTRQRYIARLEP